MNVLVNLLLLGMIAIFGIAIFFLAGVLLFALMFLFSWLPETLCIIATIVSWIVIMCYLANRSW